MHADGQHKRGQLQQCHYQQGAVLRPSLVPLRPGHEAVEEARQHQDGHEGEGEQAVEQGVFSEEGEFFYT